MPFVAVKGYQDTSRSLNARYSEQFSPSWLKVHERSGSKVADSVPITQLFLQLGDGSRVNSKTSNSPSLQFKCKIVKQKQPYRCVLRKRCSENMQEIYKGTPMQKCDFHLFLKTPLEGCFCKGSIKITSVSISQVLLSNNDGKH